MLNAHSSKKLQKQKESPELDGSSEEEEEEEERKKYICKKETPV